MLDVKILFLYERKSVTSIECNDHNIQMFECKNCKNRREIYTKERSPFV
jgi:uncharacterized protein YlaI